MSTQEQNNQLNQETLDSIKKDLENRKKQIEEEKSWRLRTVIKLSGVYVYLQRITVLNYLKHLINWEVN